MDIKLKYYDLSNDNSNADVVIFQKNIAPAYENLATAWKVIRNCGRSNYHPFTFPLGLEINTRDSWGNHTPTLAADYGESYRLTLNPSGNELVHQGKATNSREIQVRNDLKRGSMSACIYRDQRLLAIKNIVAPGQMAVFQFKPSIYIGLASQVEEGQTLNSAVLSASFTELSLFGIASADIVMTGGGAGPDATPYAFRLENVVLI